MTPDSSKARAFNMGSDARIAGDPITDNPCENHTLEYKYWREGWLNVDGCWGHDAHGWARPLPEIRKE